MKKAAALFLGLGLVAAWAALGVVNAGAKTPPTSFGGSCSLQGTVTFNPPVTNTEQALDVAYDATGSCSGNLNGHQVSNDPVRLDHSGHSLGSCLSARTTEPGQGRITFADGTVVPYSFTFQAVGTEVFFSFSGKRSGSADAHGSFLTARTPPDAGLNCAGAGDPELPMDMTLSTDSPLVG